MNPNASTSNNQKRKNKNFMMIKHKVQKKKGKRSFKDKQVHILTTIAIYIMICLNWTSPGVWYYAMWALAITLPMLYNNLIIAYETTGPIRTKLCRNDVAEVLDKNIPYFVFIQQKTWPPCSILVCDWLKL